ncbi:MAG: alpha/beta hydrolase [Myxococcota bacterium]|nr:alpha/beta hydrolase [Myxococcota bacterium]
MNIRLALIVIVPALILSLAPAGHWMNGRFETLERPKAPSDPETFFLATRSGRVHVLDLGEGDEVLLLLHGTGRSLADWQEGLAERLAPRFRVVAIDYYGHGLSDRSHALRYGIALWARQAIDVLDALSIPRATVVGHSAGGAVAAIVAADHPERIRRAVFIGHGMAMDPVQIVPLIPGVGEWRLSRTAIFSDVFSPEHERRLATAWSIQGTRSALLTFLRRQYTIDGLRLLTRTYEEIEGPVLQVHGSLDASIPVRAARTLSPRLRDGRFRVLEGVGHDVHVEAQAELARAIIEFVGDGRRTAGL